MSFHLVAPPQAKRCVSPGYDSLGWEVGNRWQSASCPLAQASHSLWFPPLFYPLASRPCGPLLRQFPETSYFHLSVRINKQSEAPMSLLNVSSKLYSLARYPCTPRKLSLHIGNSWTPEPCHIVPCIKSPLNRQEAPALTLPAAPPLCLGVSPAPGVPGWMLRSLLGCWQNEEEEEEAEE